MTNDHCPGLREPFSKGRERYRLAILAAFYLNGQDLISSGKDKINLQTSFPPIAEVILGIKPSGKQVCPHRRLHIATPDRRILCSGGQGSLVLYGQQGLVVDLPLG